MASGWFGVLRSILELCYFVAGIVIAVFAGLGLRQFTLTKRIATTSAKREALKFAAERCQYFANRCVPAYSRVHAEHERLKLTFLKTPLRFSIETQTANPEVQPKVRNSAGSLSSTNRARLPHPSRFSKGGNHAPKKPKPEDHSGLWVLTGVRETLVVLDDCLPPPILSCRDRQSN